MKKILTILLLAIAGFSAIASAATATLAWDASPSSGVGGYKVSYGKSSNNYTTTIDAGRQTAYTVLGLQEGTKYYFAVKAYDSTKTTESPYSNEVSFTPKVVVVVTPPPVVVHPGTTGLVASYDFEDSGTTVTDASGNGNHGTITNTVSIDNGHTGKALSFNGKNSWVTVKDSASLDLSKGMTIEAWVYQKSAYGNTVVIKETSGGAVYNLYSSEDFDTPVTSINAGGYRVAKDSQPLPLGKWAYLTSTYDGQFLRLYVDGVEVAKNAQTGAIKSSSGVLRIGGNSVWGEYFDGYIDDVRIYNRALTAIEVTTNFNSPAPTPTPISLTAPTRLRIVP